MTDFDLVIRSGTLVISGEVVRADIGVRGHTIAALGSELQGHRYLDADGLLVLPGAVDPHVHLQMPAGATTSSDDWETGTIAALCGGTTTLVDFVEPESDQPLREALAERRAEAENRAAADYALHMTLPRADAETLAEIPAVVAAGIPTFKAYTTYEGFGLTDDEILAVMEAVRAAGGMLLVHAENDAIARHETNRLLHEGKTAPRYHPCSRPPAAEGEAISRVLALAEITRVPLYLVHISTERGVAAATAARARGQEVYGETCPQYLLLTEDEYERPGFEGAKFVCAPPLRSATDNEALWKALGRGDLRTVGTDHCPFRYQDQKTLGRDSFDQIPGGLPGVEARLALLYTFGVTTGRLSLPQWVDLCCTAPARVMGLHPQKGTLAPGADADIVLFDPEKRVTLSQKILHEQVDYTPYEGLEIQGYPVTTLLRGRVVMREGQFVGTPGEGRFLKRARQGGHGDQPEPKNEGFKG
ncbi:MAG: dihydropyrimidinase [Anaerolineae bacterium]